jgi:pimeloyl-ACP methyl ester carboxylesterase
MCLKVLPVATLLILTANSVFAGCDPETKWAFGLSHPTQRGLIIFVHGVIGNVCSTWGPSGQYWPDLLKTDPDGAFKGYDILVYQYPTHRTKSSEAIPFLAATLGNRLSVIKIKEYKEIIFIAHSMGGLVVREYVMANLDIVSRIRLLYFASVPSGGSSYASYLKRLTANGQVTQLAPDEQDASYVQGLALRWTRSNLPIQPYCVSEHDTYLGVIWVSYESAHLNCSKGGEEISADHVTISKPQSHKADTYTSFKSAFMTSRVIGDAGERTCEPPRDGSRCMEETVDLRPATSTTAKQSEEECFPAGVAPCATLSFNMPMKKVKRALLLIDGEVLETRVSDYSGYWFQSPTPDGFYCWEPYAAPPGAQNNVKDSAIPWIGCKNWGMTAHTATLRIHY